MKFPVVLFLILAVVVAPSIAAPASETAEMVAGASARRTDSTVVPGA